LAQAQRMLDLLPTNEQSVQEYRDFIPYVLDRLDNVWRTIDSESKGKRTPAFASWWREQYTPSRQMLKALRNAELKQGVQSTRKRSRFRGLGHIRIREDGRVTVHGEDGSEVRELTAVEVESKWDFNVLGLEDRPVQEVLEEVVSRLDAEVVPTAERLLGGAD
jgi:hypothetical protein